MWKQLGKQETEAPRGRPGVSATPGILWEVEMRAEQPCQRAWQMAGGWKGLDTTLLCHPKGQWGGREGGLSSQSH